MKIFVSILLSLLILVSCQTKENKIDLKISYNLIQPHEGIYAIIKSDVVREETESNFYEKIISEEGKVISIERFDSDNKLTDDLSTPAITKFEYDANGHVKFSKYYNKEKQKAADKVFGYFSVEYIYDEYDRVIMEIYRTKENKLLTVPKNKDGDIVKKDFLAPVLAYEYLGDKLKIKAFDEHFNFLKEVIGEKPCIPFIDCGEYE